MRRVADFFANNDIFVRLHRDAAKIDVFLVDANIFELNLQMFITADIVITYRQELMKFYRNQRSHFDA